MRCTETQEVGRIYRLFEHEIGTGWKIATKGSEVQLRSTINRTGRSWYLQGNIGMISWYAPADDTYNLCERWLAANGYKRQGDMPPDCFEYRQSRQQ